MILVEQLRALQDMLSSEGWLLFAATVQAQQDAAVAGIVQTPLAKMDDVLAQQWQLGGIAKVAEVMALPETLVEQLRRDIETEKENETTE